MSLINTLENKLGRYAIPGLINIIAGFQVMAWIMIKLQPSFVLWLVLNKTLLLHGEVWRLVTFVFVPGNDNPLWMVVSVMFLIMIGRTLDQAWGPFRVNLYVLAGIVFAAIGVLLQQTAWTEILKQPGIERIMDKESLRALAQMGDAGVGCSLWFDASLLFAFAFAAPDYEILLFFILPLKSKYIGMLAGAKLLLDFIDASAVRVPMLFCLLNFFIAAGPSLYRWLTNRSKVAVRRSRFDSAKLPEGSFLHKCQGCGKTELDDPKLDFRVNAEGVDFCNVCREKRKVA